MPSEGLFISPTLQSLRLTMDDAALRQQAISSNIANVNTPGYQRVDVSASFQNAYTNALSELSQGETVSTDDMPAQTIEKAAVQGPAKPDGNTIQIEDEMVPRTVGVGAHPQRIRTLDERGMRHRVQLVHM